MTRATDIRRVAVVGAGLAGIAAGRTLADAGLDVRLFDRGRGPGGRCSSRLNDSGPFDHGAQYFTVRDPRFAAAVAPLEQAGTVARWSGRMVSLQDGRATPIDRDSAFVAQPTMRALGDALAADLDVVTATTIKRARACGRGWRLEDESGRTRGDYDALLLAMPAEQAHALTPIGHRFRLRLGRRHSTPCWAGMFAFETPLAVGFDAARVIHPDVAWLARDTSKPGRPRGDRWVVHSTPAYAAARLDAPPAQVVDELGQQLVELLDAGAIHPSFAAAHRWRLARPVDAGGGILCDADLRLAVCGDWSTEPRIEGAWLAGLEAGAALARTLDAVGIAEPA